MVLVILLGLALVAVFVIFLVPLADCPKCTARDPSGAWSYAYHDLVALRGIGCCMGKGKVTPYRSWKIKRLLKESGLRP